MEVIASTLINALPIALIRGICNVDCKERKSVKKMALSDRREFCHF